MIVFGFSGKCIWGVLLIICFFLQNSCNVEGVQDNDIEVEPEMRVELLVKEPLVIDPVAYVFDEGGDLYVIEDRGYPDPAEGGSPVTNEGRVVLLKDSNGDGQYDKRYEFADDLTYPNGIMAWKGGIFVTCAPDIWYMKDTTGDGVADIKEKVLTGFFDTKTSQIRMSHPTLGPDGWVYVSSGLNGGNVYSPIYPDRDTISFAASDSRFHPETYEFETVGGKSQFGMTFDAYGHRFGVSNRHPILQVVIEPRYLDRNPYLPYNNTVKEVSKVAAEAVVFPLTDIVTTSDFHPNLMGESHYGTFTSASSTYIYYGLGLSEEHQGDAFICESAQNLVQRQVLSADGGSYSSDIVYEDREFLASRDQWFRPVYVNNGPDDGLYVVDMYRKVIDHPSYVPEEVRDSLDYDAGKDRGRIYRIVREDYSLPLSEKEWFTGEDGIEEMISRLDSDIEWDSETAFRLLLEDWDGSEPEKIEAIFYTSENPRNRVRALNILAIKNKLKEEVLLEALKDRESGIRERSILLSEEKINQSKSLREAVILTSLDEEAMVQLQSALVLGSLKSEEALHGLAEIAIRHGEDQWIRQAVLSGLEGRMDAYLESMRSIRGKGSKGYAMVMKDLSQMFGMGASISECRHLIDYMVKEEKDSEVQLSSLLGLLEGVSSRSEASGEDDILLWLMRDIDLGIQAEFMEKIINAARNEIKSEEGEVNALHILGYTTNPETQELLRSAIRPDMSPRIQEAGVQALVSQRRKSGGEMLLEAENWRGYSPQIRSSIISTMVSHSIYLPILLESIEEGVVSSSDIPSVTRRRLLSSSDDETRKKAEAAFSEIEGGDRMLVYEAYKSRITNTGDVEVGERVFKRSCAVCHSYDGEGGNVGPDLTDIKNQPAEAILLHTIVPNYEVYPTYQTLSIETEDDRHYAGWVVSETSNSLTLRTASGEEETIMRSNIRVLTNTGQSLMPDGLERTMTEDEMNDLIAYLKQGGVF